MEFIKYFLLDGFVKKNPEIVFNIWPDAALKGEGKNK